MIRFIDLFAGIGGFRYGLEQANSSYKCVYSNEWNKYAAQIYEKNFGDKPDTRDITGVSSTDIPHHDLLIGGFPCQSFSIAGLRAGFEDTRGTLFFQIARILADKRPRYFLLENVKGLLSHDGGKTFQTILRVLSDLGYEYQWQVLNSRNFGVPQNRERIYIVGHLRGESRPKIFPFQSIEHISESKQPEKKEAVAHTLTARQGGPDINQTYVGVTEVRSERGKQIRRQMRKAGRDWSPRREKEFVARTDGLANTLIATNNFENLVTNGIRLRRLTPLECERLQGFPDNWTEGISDTQRYKCLGNAVTTTVVTAIVERLYQEIEAKFPC